MQAARRALISDNERLQAGVWPVVITATFVGFLVAGSWGSLAATIGIFLPSFLLVLVVAPLLAPAAAPHLDDVEMTARRDSRPLSAGIFAIAPWNLMAGTTYLYRLAWKYR